MCLQSWIYRILAMSRWQEHGVPSFRTGSLSWHFQQFNLDLRKRMGSVFRAALAFLVRSPAQLQG
jgi:hypothetical protein